MKTYYLHDKPYSKAIEIEALQVALKKAGLYHGSVDGIFGPGTAHAAQAAKYRLGYPRRAVKPSGGQRLLDYLRGSRKLSAAYRVRRRARGFGLSKVEKIRDRIVFHAMWAIPHEREIHYNQTRPMDHLKAIHALPWWADCSEFVTTIYKWAGGPDPNGRNFDGQGYTGTMLDHGRWIPLWQAKPGDVVIWGAAPGHHTAVIVSVTNPTNPMLVSHGQERGPLHISLLTENSYQRRYWQVRRYLKD